jgi:hypothetical protein
VLGFDKAVVKPREFKGEKWNEAARLFAEEKAFNKPRAVIALRLI